VTKKWARAALTHPAFTGISRQHLGTLIEELADPWTARREAALHQRRGGHRRRKAGAGPKHQLVFTDRIVLTVVHLRHQLPHAALAQLYTLGRATISDALGQIRPLLAERGFAVPDRPGVRLPALADVFAYAAAEGITLRIDGSKTKVRRPAAHRPGGRAFVWGKRRQNTIKTTTISDSQGRTLWSCIRPARPMHDQTAVRTEGIAEQLRLHPGVKAEVDQG
jgi:Helix-turn-helix of DDE superfamily endonuclease